MKKVFAGSLFYLFILLLLLSHQAFAQTGRITGKVVDAQNGEAVIGANIFLESTGFGSASDLDGNYLILSAPPGKYTMIVSVIGYAQTKINNVEVKENGLTRIDVSLKQEILTTETVVVEAKALQNTDAALLKSRQKSNAISDAISADAITRSGSGDAAAAMSRVTGASVVGGKYVYIRGLGERYATTQLNGAELPSADPDKKSFNMDIVPTNLLDNIVTKKTFTPDEPGNFSGGIVNIGTKSFPETFTLKLSNSVSYNSQANLTSDFLTYEGGSADWLGMDDGTRDMPSEFNDPDLYIPTAIESRSDKQKALLLDRLSKSFTSQMYPVTEKSPLNQNYSFGIGNQVRLFDMPVGYFASLSYNNKYSSYHNGTVGRWLLAGPVAQAENLNPDMVLVDSKSSREALWGGLGTLSIKPQSNHEISLNFMYTNSGESVTRYQHGSWPNQMDESSVYETRSLLYTQRELKSMQLKGQHHLNLFSGLDMDWNASRSFSRQDEPDLRFFSNDYSVVYENGAAIDTVYGINLNLYNVPTRFYRNLNENKSALNINIGIPFRQWSGLSGKIKFGAAYTGTDREFRERRFELRQQTAVYDGDPEAFFAQTGIVDSSNARRIWFGNYIVDVSTPRSNYDGDEYISAAYLMTELPLTPAIRFIGGARLEATRMEVTSQDTSEAVGKLNNNDWLPSLGLIYQVSDNMNVRMSYGRTLARPNMREKAAFRSFEFLGDYLFVGNTELKRTLIDNYDLRWEWFSRPGEIYAVSAFYKQFDNPIERVFDNTRESYTYMNVPQGMVIGAEFEARKNLDVFWSYLNNFSVSANLSLIHSEVDLTGEELKVSEDLDPGMDKNRPLFGQSPYIINLELAYSNPRSGSNLNLMFNQFGKRLAEVKYGATPDVYEMPRPMLDLVGSQRLAGGLELKGSAKNLLNSDFRQVMSFNGKEYVHLSYHSSVNYSLGLSYNW
jgi:TonB-dependent receptor